MCFSAHCLFLSACLFFLSLNSVSLSLSLCGSDKERATFKNVTRAAYVDQVCVCVCESYVCVSRLKTRLHSVLSLILKRSLCLSLSHSQAKWYLNGFWFDGGEGQAEVRRSFSFGCVCLCLSVCVCVIWLSLFSLYLRWLGVSSCVAFVISFVCTFQRISHLSGCVQEVWTIAHKFMELDPKKKAGNELDPVLVIFEILSKLLKFRAKFFKIP